ncbi:MAG TPA: tetraacyldisaccharide 4'-kinase, partial [Terriglobales bacterium]|nr:tetraacyldisaccharide 4'-kinase [Terriglobales bacterium]
MSPLASIFGAAIAARNALYDHRLLVARRLRGPVISVGNISVGGTGKTPFVIMLGELLKQRGISFDVLSRGYRRKTSGVLLVDPQGTPRDYGDEPLLIARKLGVPVFVGESRYLAGLASEHRFGPQLHLLDDGFQHRQLARDYDIVLVTPDDANGRLLPTGRLREPVSALRRADAVVLTPGTSPSGLPLAGKLVMRAHRGIGVGNAPRNPVAFCAIGRPDQFFRQLRESNVQTAAEITFRDHHSYTQADVANLRAAATRNGANGFITTEKDAVNIGPLAAQLEP